MTWEHSTISFLRLKTDHRGRPKGILMICCLNQLMPNRFSLT